MNRRSDDGSERQARAGFPWTLAPGPLPPLFDGTLVSRGAEIYGGAVRDQMRQWQSALARLARGSYGPQDASSDLQESTRRTLQLCTQLAGLWWDAGLGAAAGPDPGPPAPRPPAPRPAAPRPAAPRPAAPRPAGARPGGGGPPAPRAPQPTRTKAPSKPAPRPAAARRSDRAEPASSRRGPGGRDRKPSARARAERFLRQSLAGGPRPARELLALAAEAGISKTTLQRAKRQLAIQGRRDGFGPRSRVLWELPPET